MKSCIRCAKCGKDLEPFYGDAQLKFKTPEMDLTIGLRQNCMEEISASKWQDKKIEDVWETFQRKIKNIF